MPILPTRFVTGRSASDFPDFTVVDDDDGLQDEPTSDKTASGFPDSSQSKDYSSFLAPNNREDGDFDVWVPPPPREKKRPIAMSGTSWMDKNKKFRKVDINPINERSVEEKSTDKDRDNSSVGQQNGKTFRQDFRGTRVFVQNIPDQVTWQDLKDHFRIAGEVVFASVSVDRDTGAPKGHGVVQFETIEGAQKAIKIMRDHPLDGAQLYVRPDAQEREGAALRNVVPGGKQGPTPPSKWRCADEDALESMKQEEYKAIRSLIKARDDARRRKNYAASDEMRNELKFDFGVHLDDRLKMWWVSVDGKSVPTGVSEIKGNGRWGGLAPWRQIPTTPENDACVDPDLVMGLLSQRDIARREKDFKTSDSLLEEARTSPDGDLSLRIHDESRTWRIWTNMPPPTEPEGWIDTPVSRTARDSGFAGDEVDQDNLRQALCEECIAVVEEYAPKKVPEVRQMLEQFPGREASILQKMKQRYTRGK